MSIVTTFSDIGIDPIEGAEIFDIVGIYQQDLLDPKKFHKAKDIVKFFQGINNKRWVMTKILSGKPRSDRMDIIWEYVQLQNERQSQLKILDKDVFTPEIRKKLEENDIPAHLIDEMRLHLAILENDPELKKVEVGKVISSLIESKIARGEFVSKEDIKWEKRLQAKNYEDKIFETKKVVDNLYKITRDINTFEEMR